MIRWIFLTITLLVFALSVFIVLMVRRREQAKRTLTHIPDVEPEIIPNVEEISVPTIEIEAEAEAALELLPEQPPEPVEILSISVLANPNQPFGGYELLQSLLSNNLRFGKYQIFHYHELDKPLFSLASATKPGTFDMNAMGGYSTPGLTLFMELHDDPHLEAIFEKMLQVGSAIAKDLGGYLVDDQHQPLGDSGIHAMRTRIRNHYRAQEVSYEHSE